MKRTESPSTFWMRRQVTRGKEIRVMIITNSPKEGEKLRFIAEEGAKGRGIWGGITNFAQRGPRRSDGKRHG